MKLQHLRTANSGIEVKITSNKGERKRSYFDIYDPRESQYDEKMKKYNKEQVSFTSDTKSSMEDNPKT